MTPELVQQIRELESEYNVVGKFYYSNFFTPTGNHDLYQWLKSCYQERYEPNDRLLVIQDISEVYEYSDLPGRAVTALQKNAADVDISNCFICVVTQNKNISAELQQAHVLYGSGPDPMQHAIAPGDPIPAAEVLPTNTFCAAPWAHLYIGTDGNVLPCCAGDPKFPLGNINESSIEEIISGPAAVAMRLNMIKGRRTKECSACYRKEDLGQHSLRQMFNTKFANDPIEVDETGNLINFKPLSLDIRVNKLCNLKCRSCGPYYSSAIEQEFKEIYGITTVESLNYKKRQAALFEVMAYLPYVTSIYFGGGEPLLAQENYDIINELLRLNRRNTALHINTNFTSLDYKGQDVLELLSKFDCVRISASLDAYDSVAGYVRHGTDWTVIENNLHRVKQYPKIEFEITSTVGLTNVESLIELQKTWHNQGLLDIQHFKISQMVTDSELSLQVLPKHHKDRLAVVIRNHCLWLEKNDAENLAQEWLNVLRFMTSEDQSHLLPKFAKSTKLLDQHRNESFCEVFPQYADLLNYA